MKFFQAFLLLSLSTLDITHAQVPSVEPTFTPSVEPTVTPSVVPTVTPSAAPSVTPTVTPSAAPSVTPTVTPSATPTVTPSSAPSVTPSSAPTSVPTFEGTITGAAVYDKKRHRQGGLCENHCSNHGTCELNLNCKCFNGPDGAPEWTGPDCSLRTCPSDLAWVSSTAANRDNLSPVAECSNQGICDRKSGACTCFPGYEGIACQRTVCPNSCNSNGVCLPLKILASQAGHTYSLAWDANKQFGCYCDPGYRGPACEFQECPSGTDPLDGFGAEAGRDCSGRGLCNYQDGTCNCFSGFYGTRCQIQTTLF